MLAALSLYSASARRPPSELDQNLAHARHPDHHVADIAKQAEPGVLGELFGLTAKEGHDARRLGQPAHPGRLARIELVGRGQSGEPRCASLCG